MSNFLNNFSVLVVEDDLECSTTISNLLRDKCKNVYTAVSGSDGLEFFQNKSADIIITSNNLKDLDANKMKELYADIGRIKPIVAISTLDEHQELINAISLGVKNYLFKPINNTEVIKTLENIAQQLYMKEEYEKTNSLLKQYKNAVDASCIVTKTDKSGNIIYANEQFSKISGYSLDELIGKNHRILRHPDMDKATFKEMWKTISSKKIWKGIVRNLAKDGSTYIVNATIMPILDEENEIIQYIAIRNDITELMNQKEVIVRQTTDALTKLPNREKLLEDLKISKYPNLAIININNFRDINDLYGFDIGDEVLIYVAKMIDENMKHLDCELYKLPSDEYAILIDTADDIYSFEEMVENLIQTLKTNIFQIGEHTINIGVTIGIAHSKRNLFSNCDIALQDAKKLKKHYLVYNEESSSREKTRENLNWHHTIKSAIKNNKIVPYFQPIYNIKTNKIEKYESLVRLIDDKDAVISPFFFLDIAKKYRLYEYLTRIMIEKTLDYFEDKDFEFSINLSIEDILDDQMVLFIIDSVKKFNKPQKIVFEITESEGIENFVEVEGFLQSIKELGCKIAIDDFGTGYSNFEYIIKLNVDFIKIDGSLIKNIANSNETRLVVETILSFAKKLGIKTITEFVSSVESYNIVEELGADFIQGYYIGQPKENIQ